MRPLCNKSVCTTPGTCAGCQCLTSAWSVFPMARNCQPESRVRELGSDAVSGNAPSREKKSTENTKAPRRQQDCGQVQIINKGSFLSGQKIHLRAAAGLGCRINRNNLI